LDIQFLIPLLAAFVLGAMSPGPSLAVVIRNSVNGGRRQGVMTGIGHGLGFGIYAFLAAIGLAAAVSASDAAATAIRWGGIALLIYLGVTYLKRSMANSDPESHSESPRSGSGFVQGFSIAILNPKILAWLLAIFAPIIDSDLSLFATVGVALIGMTIDGTWYVLMAVLITATTLEQKLRAASRRLDGAMGALMLLFATLLFVDTLQ
jgi:threonine/homoserine/homoserine lactone efflux protein